MIKDGRYRVIGLTFKITLSMYRKWVDRVPYIRHNIAVIERSFHNLDLLYVGIKS